MLRYLFGRLTEVQKPAQALFDRIVAEARQPHWYIEGMVPDTVDGRFGMLATVCALAMVRIESRPGAERQSAALTERFVEAMDAEHRQMGMNDPALGKRVRKLVASLARRTGEWRRPTSGEGDWTATARSSVYKDEDAGAGAVRHSADSLRSLWRRLEAASDDELAEGRF